MLLASQALASPSSKRLSITELLHRFRATRSLRVLVRLALSIVREGRALELLYGGYCSLIHRPSRIHPAEDPEALARILERRAEFVHRAVLSRDELMLAYGDTHALRELPAGFASARRESVWRENGRLILGEYGEGSRLTCITEGGCVVSDHYVRMRGVRHIHAIQRYGGRGEFLVATGDGDKLLDLWEVSGTEVHFVRTIRKWLAGYTAAAEVNGEYYFGSDFSGRPNFITVLGGPRYFFPEKAYRMFVAEFNVLFDRYLVSVNKELDSSGGRRTMSVFDTRLRRFVYCDYLPACHPDRSEGA